MIRINHDLKAIFCHIPKCGGTSVERALDDWERVNHTKIARKAYPDKFIGMGQYVYDYLPRYFVFSIVRNPYDRFASGLTHVNTNKAWDRYWYYEHLHATQTQTLGDLLPDYIMRLESINKDWEFIQDRFGVGKLPHVNKSRKEILTDQQIMFVNIRYDIDFKKFGYDRR